MNWRSGSCPRSSACVVVICLWTSGSLVYAGAMAGSWLSRLGSISFAKLAFGATFGNTRARACFQAGTFTLAISAGAEKTALSM